MWLLGALYLDLSAVYLIGFGLFFSSFLFIILIFGWLEKVSRGQYTHSTQTHMHTGTQAVVTGKGGAGVGRERF